MWMMGYNDGADLYMADSFNGRKFRPLIPRTISSATPSGGGGSGSGRNGPVITSSPCLTRIHGGATDVFALNHNHIGMMSEQSKREFNPQHQVVVSSRWNPTPEQLRTLEELYRRGTRTPSADQIQHITAQLRRYGKIEGKNVFYWFQNHKARERQKRRRQMESDDNQQNINGCSGQREVETLGRKEAEGAASTKNVLGVDQLHHHQANKNGSNSHNWASPHMNCTALEEENATSAIQKTVVKAGRGLELKSSSLEHYHQWMNMIEHDGESQCRLKNVNGTWAMMQRHQVSACPPPTRFINTTGMDPKSFNNNKYSHNHHLTSFLIGPPPPLCPAPPYCSSLRSPQEEIFINSHLLDISDGDEEDEEEENEFESSQTLQLFPLRSGDGNCYTNEETEMSASTINSFVAHPHQFFEFLPLKN
ncbi:hypothetical protein SAY87_021359 [Trapa incisa]|uniref:Homeobox domain-containing protein n=1 Tax=Trapa incisa TaxID=236973 RepID=A0AAN7JRZ4_9MYRT|nr:hypothetical protein SAY87_021359 [Trapa incisa]